MKFSISMRTIPCPGRKNVSFRPPLTDRRAVCLSGLLFWPLLLSGQVGVQFSDKLRSGGQGPVMVTLEPGEFRMGCVSGVLCVENLPVHTVTLEQPFALSVYEVTRAQFGEFVERTGYVTDSEWPGVNPYGEHPAGCMGESLAASLERKAWDIRWEPPWGMGAPMESAPENWTWRDPGHRQTADHPVVCITWSDAMAYVDWLASETGRPYRLPSESEWEYAARADTPRAPLDPVAEYCDWRKAPGPSDACLDPPFTEAVGHDGPNAFGLYDMERNASEWVEDCWNPNYADAPGDGTARLVGRCQGRVIRGGGWGNTYAPHEERGSYDNLHLSDNLLGFRVAQSPSE